MSTKLVLEICLGIILFLQAALSVYQYCLHSVTPSRSVDGKEHINIPKMFLATVFAVAICNILTLFTTSGILSVQGVNDWKACLIYPAILALWHGAFLLFSVELLFLSDMARKLCAPAPWKPFLVMGAFYGLYFGCGGRAVMYLALGRDMTHPVFEAYCQILDGFIVLFMILIAVFSLQTMYMVGRLLTRGNHGTFLRKMAGVALLAVVSIVSRFRSVFNPSGPVEADYLESWDGVINCSVVVFVLSILLYAYWTQPRSPQNGSRSTGNSNSSNSMRTTKTSKVTMKLSESKNKKGFSKFKDDV